MTLTTTHGPEDDRRKLTQAETRLVLGGQPISKLLPIESADGYILDTLALHCPECRNAVADHDTRARCTPWPDHHEIRAIALCRECQLYVPVNMRWLNDGSIVGQHPQTGRWTRWKPGRRGGRAWWDCAGRLGDALHRLAARLA